MIKSKFKNLFEPIIINKMKLNNRFVMMPMGTNFANIDGSINQTHIDYYEKRAIGKVGLIVVENCCVDYPKGQNGLTQLRLDSDVFVPSLANLVDSVHRHGTKIIVQINHSGANLDKNSTKSFMETLSKEEIEKIAEKFSCASKRAIEAGADGVEIHAAHGYLLSSFLSKALNKREDEFGKSVENRARFIKLVCQKVRNAIGKDKCLSIRLSIDEFNKNGNDVNESLNLLSHYVEYVDLISCSAALKDNVQYQVDASFLEDGWRSYLAKEVKQRFNKATIAMGNIRNPFVAEKIVKEKEADLVGLGRALLADSDYVKKCYDNKENMIRPCISCNKRCLANRAVHKKGISCTVNPCVGINQIEVDATKIENKKILIIGAGVAGLTSACVLSKLKANVTIIDKRDYLGGTIMKLVKSTKNQRISSYLDYLIAKTKSYDSVTFLLNMEANDKNIAEINPQIIVNATSHKLDINSEIRVIEINDLSLDKQDRLVDSVKNGYNVKYLI